MKCLVALLVGCSFVIAASVADNVDEASLNTYAPIWKQLNLTDEQKAAVESIERDSKAQLGAIFSDGGLSREQKDSKLESIKDNLNQAVVPILEPSQVSKFQSLTGREYNGNPGATSPQMYYPPVQAVEQGGHAVQPSTASASGNIDKSETPEQMYKRVHDQQNLPNQQPGTFFAPGTSPSRALPLRPLITTISPNQTPAPRATRPYYNAYPAGTPHPVGGVYVVKTPSPITPYTMSTPRPIGTPRPYGTPRPIGTPRSYDQPSAVGTPRPIGTPRAYGTPRY